MTTRKDLEKIGIVAEMRPVKNHGYGNTHNGDGKYAKRWLRTADGRVWLTSPRGGYRLAGERTPPKGF